MALPALLGCHEPVPVLYRIFSPYPGLGVPFVGKLLRYVEISCIDLLVIGKVVPFGKRAPALRNKIIVILAVPVFRRRIRSLDTGFYPACLRKDRLRIVGLEGIEVQDITRIVIEPIAFRTVSHRLPGKEGILVSLDSVKTFVRSVIIGIQCQLLIPVLVEGPGIVQIKGVGRIVPFRTVTARQAAVQLFRRSSGIDIIVYGIGSDFPVLFIRCREAEYDPENVPVRYVPVITEPYIMRQPRAPARCLTFLTHGTVSTIEFCLVGLESVTAIYGRIMEISIGLVRAVHDIGGNAAVGKHARSISHAKAGPYRTAQAFKESLAGLDIDDSSAAFGIVPGRRIGDKFHFFNG